MTVINTSPAIHLHAVLPGGLGSLAGLVGEVTVPWEVGQELAAGHAKDAIWQEIQSLPSIHHRSHRVAVHPLLSAQIDMGEAAVIQTALDEAHDADCILFQQGGGPLAKLNATRRAHSVAHSEDGF